ncbi:MAG TPA: flagellar basal body-associated FliL family protein [Rhizomicrobium sp.]|nr:flagellar basal body-associated FliL family protein [Rhizomicrobium sp.]
MSNDTEAAPEGEAPKEKKGIMGMLFGSKLKMMISAGVLLLLLLGGGGGAYYFFFMSAPEPKPGEETAGEEHVPIVPPTIAFYEIPDIIVNIQTVDGSPAYLKLGISLEIEHEEEKAGLQAVMPRVIDQFQAYLRELRVDDLKGSMGVLRIKEELLRRINLAAQPYKVKDVLLKDMIVQ